MRAKLFGFRFVLSTFGVVAVISFLLLPLVAERINPREIVVVARDMAFFVEGQAAPNPVIRVRRGEHIALTFRNEEAGMTHDFAISGWSVATRQLRGNGVDRISFTVPDVAGAAEYVCSPHSATMRGVILIE
jgi:plastocyanin